MSVKIGHSIIKLASLVNDMPATLRSRPIPISFVLSVTRFRHAISLAMAVLSYSALPSLSAPIGPTNTNSDYGHFDQQAQIGAKTHGTVDCGRAAEADMQVGAPTTTWQPSAEIKELIGKPLPEFADDLLWVNSKPLKLNELRGHPVFIRFWNRNCQMCVSSAPLMNELFDDYSQKGLVVIGIHHAKSNKGDTVQEVAQASKENGFKFPVAIDNSWKTIQRLWIHSTPRAYSSASFLIDKNGVVVWGHDLGRLERGTPAAASLHKAIDKLLVDERSASEQPPVSQ